MESTGSKRKRVAKQVKSNNPPSAYALFIRDTRRGMVDKPSNFIEFTKLCSAKWKGMTPEEKGLYHEMAREGRTQMQILGIKAKRRAIKEPGTRKASNFWKFSKSIRQMVHKELKERALPFGKTVQMTDVSKEIGRRWQLLSAEEKKGFEGVGEEGV